MFYSITFPVIFTSGKSLAIVFLPNLAHHMSLYLFIHALGHISLTPGTTMNIQEQHAHEQSPPFYLQFYPFFRWDLAALLHVTNEWISFCFSLLRCVLADHTSIILPPWLIRILYVVIFCTYLPPLHSSAIPAVRKTTQRSSQVSANNRATVSSVLFAEMWPRRECKTEHSRNPDEDKTTCRTWSSEWRSVKRQPCFAPVPLPHTVTRVPSCLFSLCLGGWWVKAGVKANLWTFTPQWSPSLNWSYRQSLHYRTRSDLFSIPCAHRINIRLLTYSTVQQRRVFLHRNNTLQPRVSAGSSPKRQWRRPDHLQAESN